MSPAVTQVYELQSAAEAEICIEAGVDHIGSVLLSEDVALDPGIREAQRAIRRAGRTGCLIPLFTDPDTICRAIDFHEPHILHFCEALAHGESGARGIEAAQRVEGALALQQEIRRRRPSVKLMRAIPVGQTGYGAIVPSVELALRFAAVSDFFIADTLLAPIDGVLDQPVAGFVGITGKCCCWDTARSVVEATPVPLIIAGGLNAGNARAALAATGAWGADSCTLTNRRDSDARPVRFQKDPDAVRRFVSACRF